jgi:putative ABC transport system permease protein
VALFRRVTNLFRRSRVDRDIEAELRAHIELRIDANVAAGMSTEEARRDALFHFGNPTIIKERVTEADAAVVFGSLWRNVRFALRQLRRSPGFALTAILTLALGIGPNVAIFSIIWATFLAPMPYPDANQVVMVWNHNKGERIPTRGEDYAAYAAESHSFQSLSFESWLVVHLTNSDHAADQEGGLPESPGLISRTVRMPLLLGRDFLPDEGGPGRDHVVILSHWLWQHRYYSDPNILGKSILIEDQPYAVVGVMRAHPHERGGEPEFNIPIRFTPGVPSPQFGVVTGRLKPGVSLAEAQAELSVIDQRIAAQRYGGQDTQQSTLSVEPYRNIWLDAKTRHHLWLLLAAVCLVLLIACANLANLLLARGTSRRQELAVRSALGASREQIFIQLLTESLTLACLGCAIGIALGWALMRLSVALFPDLSILSSDTVVEMNLPVLCFAVAIALIAGIGAGCAPSWRGARVNESETLKQASRFAGRVRTPLQAALVISEVALALILLSGAGMALHSFWNLTHIDVGFRADHVLTAQLRPRGNGLHGNMRVFPSPDHVVVQQHEMLQRVRAIPGVLDAALATTMPMHGYYPHPFAVAGQAVDSAHPPLADLEAVTPSYFNTLGIQLIRGRFIDDRDDLHSPQVAMVNETFVRRYLHKDDPLTQRLLPRFFSGSDDGKTKSPPQPEYQIVGVFHDVVGDEHLIGAIQPEIYISQWQIAGPYVHIAVRTLMNDPEVIANPLQQVIASVDARVAIDHVETMNDVVGSQTSSDRFEMLLFAGFAFVALLLAAVGIYGVMAFAVAQRTHEMGVRMALGARRADVVALMVRGGMRRAVLGIGVGLAGAYCLGRVMHASLYGVASADVVSLVAVAALLLTVAALACWIPARRAARVDPMQALRAE